MTQDQSASDWQAPTVCWQTPELASSSVELGAALQLPELDEADPANCWILSANTNGLLLKSPQGLSLSSSFGRDNAQRRAAQSGFINDTFAKAIGVARLQKTLSRKPRIVDATGGLGQDACTLAALGCAVTVIERHPILHSLLLDSISEDMDITVVNDDATQCLVGVASSLNADVIYLDPMYPEQKRRGKSKKGMQILHDLIGPDTNNDGLLRTALEACKACEGYRVVAKRAQGAEKLNGSDNCPQQQLVTKILKLHRQPKFSRFEHRHGGLQVISLLAGDTQLLTLNLRLHFQL